MLCNILWSDRRRLIRHKQHFLPFRVLLNAGIDPNFPQKFFFSFLDLFINQDCVNQSEYMKCIIQGWEFNNLY